MARQKKRNLPQSSKPLTAKQQRFVDEYMIDLDGKAAATRAGYSAKSADVQASQLLSNPKVVEVVDAAKVAKTIRTHITADMVLRELALIGFSNHDHYEVDDDGRVKVKEGLDETLMRAVSTVKRRVQYDKHGNKTVTTEMSLWSKLDALKMIAAHVGACTPKKDIHVKGSLYDLIAGVEEDEENGDDEEE